MIALKRKSSRPRPPCSSGAEKPTKPWAAALRQNSRSMTPEDSHSSVLGTASLRRKPRTDSRKSSCSGSKIVRFISDALDQRARAQAAAAAHRDQSELLVVVLELMQERGQQARPGRAERMPQRPRAPARVHPGHVRLVLAAPGGHDRGERLVDLDVV